MKPSIYEIKTNALKATISRGVKTNYDWLLEVESISGEKLICKAFRALHLTKRAAIQEFNKVRMAGFLIQEN